MSRRNTFANILGHNTLFRKLLLPFIGFMFIYMLVSGLAYNYGITSTSRKILEGELRSDSQKVIASLRSRLDTVGSAAIILAENPDILASLSQVSSEALSIINSRALVVQDRFELDLVQIYSASGMPRTNLVQSTLYKVSSIIDIFPPSGKDVLVLDDRLVYLVRAEMPNGGIVIVGIDLLSELDRISFRLGLRDTLTLQQVTLSEEDMIFEDSVFSLHTPLEIGAQSFALVYSQEVSQFETIAASGRNVILLGAFLTTILLIGMMALVLRSIVRPIQQLAAAAGKLAQADFETVSLDTNQEFSHPLQIGVNDEIGQLAESFSHMSKELQGIYHGLVHDLRQANQELNEAYDSALLGWSSALELRDHATEKHTSRVAENLINFARYIGITEGDLVDYRRGALLHDVGKMAIPDSILRKNGSLSDDEWNIMRQHPIYAFVMLRKISFLQNALDIPYCHHEKWDGSGYPRGLLKSEIPLSARIFSIVDAWDALSFDRPYRKAWSREKILEYISSQGGKDFDPDLVKQFLEWKRVKN